MPLAAGLKLSHYTILGPLGAGSMGEVYHARDTRLDREVAIKVLPEPFAKDHDRLERFAREAKSLASLNHPNVAQIHGVDQVDDTCFLVLELVPGETLAERLSGGPLEVEEALNVCVQIASGLEAAHDAGVIHRDLKPGNIKLTPEGRAKVLDFGLARQEAPRGRPGSSATGPLTEEGVLLGTPGYMSPEQVRGKPIDRRSDIFAFGCVLYACLVGETAFPGETSSDVIVAILEREPNLDALPRKTSARVRELLAKCLEKDVARRLRDIGDARIELERAIANKEWTTARLETIPGRGSAWRALRPWIAGAALGAAAAIVGTYFAAPRLWPGSSPAEASPQAVTRFVVNPPLLFAACEFDTTSTLAISPDGARVAFLARERPEGFPHLYVRELGGLDATLLPGTLHAHDPFFSPDGAWLAFVSEGRMWKWPVAGGPRVELALLPGFHKGSVWGADGIITSPAANLGLFRLAAQGGELAEVTMLDESKGEVSHRWPELLPDGRHVLCTVKTAGMATFDDADIAVYSMESRQWKTVLRGGHFARYASNGRILYMRDGGIMAVPFDLERLEVTGPAVRVVSGVMSEPGSGAAQFAVSRNGTLVFAPGGPVERLVDLLWIDRAGNETPVGMPPRPLKEIALSPDGGRVAMIIAGATDAVFVYDFARGTLTRTTFEGNASRPEWTRDGQYVVYGSDRESGGIFRSRADGSGTPTKLAPDGGRVSRFHLVDSTSTLLFVTGDLGTRDIWSRSFEAGGERVPVVVGPYDQWDPRVSPDGKWLAYISSESGRPELYVRPFPSGAGRWQISDDGAEASNWSADGNALYYMRGSTTIQGAANGHRTLISVSYSTQDGFTPGTVETAFEWIGWNEGDVSPDGKRLLVFRPRDPPIRTTEIHATLNWSDGLRTPTPGQKPR